jgi:hypothetical protein
VFLQYPKHFFSTAAQTRHTQSTPAHRREFETDSLLLVCALFLVFSPQRTCVLVYRISSCNAACCLEVR